MPKPSSTMDEAEPVPSSVSIPALLDEHKAEIDKLKALVAADAAPELPAEGDGIYCLYDDIFFLRYVLSFTTAEKAIEPVRECFKYRQTPLCRELAQMALEKRLEELPAMIEAPKWQVGAPVDAQNPGSILTDASGGGVAVIIRAGMCNMSAFVDAVPKDDMWKLHLAQREGSFQICDTVTREKGTLAKMTMVMDMKGSKISDMTDRRSSNSHAEISKIAANVYPQLQDKFCIVNAPAWMGWMISFFRKVASKRAMDKVELFTSDKAMWESEWAKKRFVRERLPAFIGGGLADEHLSDKLSGRLREASPPPEITISGRSKETVTVTVPFEGKAVVDFTVSVLARGVTFGASFTKGMPDGFMQGGGTVDETVTAKKLTNPDDCTVLRKEEKIKAEDGPIKGELLVQGPGVVQFWFDNTHSMLRSKTVRYIVDMRPLETDQMLQGGASTEGVDQEAEGAPEVVASVTV